MTRVRKASFPTGPIVLLLLILSGLGYVAFVRANPAAVPSASSSTTATAAIASTCRSKHDELADVLRDLPDARLNGNRLAVDEGFWKRLSADDKTRLAIVAYCQIAAADGTGTLVVTGLHDGLRKAGMVDGNYLD